MSSFSRSFPASGADHLYRLGLGLGREQLDGGIRAASIAGDEGDVSGRLQKDIWAWPDGVGLFAAQIHPSSASIRVWASPQAR